MGIFVIGGSQINGLWITDHRAFTGDSIWRINFYSTLSAYTAYCRISILFTGRKPEAGSAGVYRMYNYTVRLLAHL